MLHRAVIFTKFGLSPGYLLWRNDNLVSVRFNWITFRYRMCNFPSVRMLINKPQFLTKKQKRNKINNNKNPYKHKPHKPRIFALVYKTFVLHTRQLRLAVYNAGIVSFKALEPKCMGLITTLPHISSVITLKLLAYLCPIGHICKTGQMITPTS